ncbi:MAG: PAS domain S-box protein [Deltaproteobacteria bacterium]|nr:PAS domain S-box protein [Deltaproteobacteria bacterium]MBW2504323.1 PAS domain S-box protein [Deltaproteobacteria bacterium]
MFDRNKGMIMNQSHIRHLKLDQVLGTVPSGLFLVGRDMKILYWNKAAERITGYSSEEAVGQHCSFLKGIPCGERCGLFDSSIEKPIINGRCLVYSKSGEQLTLLKNIDYLRDVDGEIIGGVESFIDLTREQKLEESLRQQTVQLEQRVKERTAELELSEARLRSVLDTMDDMAYIASPDFKITFLNRAMQEQFGDISGKHCYQAIHQKKAICPNCPMGRILNNRTVRDERKFGPLNLIYEVIHSPLQGDDGRTHKLAVCRDVTDRKKSEEELREANRELDAFAHSISHDLRGILAPVVTYMDFLQSQYNQVFDSQILQILQEVERQSERAIALLDDLLDLAQVGHFKPAKHPTDVGAIVKEVLEELSSATTELPKSTTLHSLPKTWIPEALVYQVFVNLINNAVLYGQSDKDFIEIGCWQDDDFQTYYVRDHGPGVSLQEKQAIFDIFYRGQLSKKVRGTGVGLAIVRKIALRCNGQAWVEDTPGGGATFCVSLPVRPNALKPMDVAS